MAPILTLPIDQGFSSPGCWSGPSGPNATAGVSVPPSMSIESGPNSRVSPCEITPATALKIEAGWTVPVWIASVISVPMLCATCANGPASCSVTNPITQLISWLSRTFGSSIPLGGNSRPSNGLFTR